MEMLNKAIEDASDFRGFVERLEQDAKATKAALSERYYITQPARRDGENRQQHRARLRAERKQRT